MKLHGRKVKRTVNIPPDLDERMRSSPINWSQIASKAFGKELKRQDDNKKKTEDYIKALY